MNQKIKYILSVFMFGVAITIMNIVAREMIAALGINKIFGMLIANMILAIAILQKI